MWAILIKMLIDEGHSHEDVDFMQGILMKLTVEMPIKINLIIFGVGQTYEDDN